MNNFGYRMQPGLARYQEYRVTHGELEAVHGAFWDTLLYTSAATLALTYFVTAGPVSDVRNMTVAGVLPYPQAFLIRAIRWYAKQNPESVDQAVGAVHPGSLENICLLTDNGALTLNIANKNYGIYPLYLFSSGGGPSGQIQVRDILIAGGASDYGMLGRPHAKNVYTLAVPIFIEPQMNFNVTTTWAAAQTLTRNLNLCVVLEGDWLRPVQ